jgi:DNA-binding NarL/FixJ family response regulator
MTRGTRLPAGRAVFVTIPPLLSDLIVEAVCQSLDLAVVAQFSERDALAEQLPALAPDLVVIGLHNGETDQIGAVTLALVPAAKVLVLSSDMRCAYLYQTQIRRDILQDCSPASLRAAILHGTLPSPEDLDRNSTSSPLDDG